MKLFKCRLPTLLLLGSLSVNGLFLAHATSNHSFIHNSPNTDVLANSSRALNEIAKKVTPAVVSITSVKKAHWFSEQMAMGMGSGIIIRSDGIILTNDHVIQNANKVTISFDEKKKATAHLIGSDPNTDLALLKLEKVPDTALPTLSFGDSDRTQVGDLAIAVGSPFGLKQSVTTGIVSAIGRGHLGVLDVEDFIQTDAAINPGNSGGPLLNSQGEMIGINAAIFSQTGGFIGIGLAIPSKIAKKVVDEILMNGRVVRGWLGVMAQDMEPGLAEYFKSPSPETGALISAIQPKSPAEKATLMSGDIILKYNNEKVTSSSHLKARVAETKIGHTIAVVVARKGDVKEMKVVVQEQPHPQEFEGTQLAGQAASEDLPSKLPFFGLAVQDVPLEILNLLELPKKSGVFVTGVSAGGPAFEAGISPGDIILSANEQKIHSSQEFFQILKHLKSSKNFVFYIQRGPTEKLYVPLHSNG